jgi:quercetin dioxygenase-like cupin family protein
MVHRQTARAIRNLKSLMATVVLVMLSFSAAPAQVAQVIAPGDGDTRLIFSAGETVAAGRPLLIKVDPVTVGATQFVVGTELLKPGQKIPVHRHANQEEILFIHQGTATIVLGDTSAVAGPGSTVFIPRNAWIGVENRGTEPTLVVFVFPMVGMEGFFRRVAPKPGETPVPLNPQERQEMFEKYQIFPKGR